MAKTKRKAKTKTNAKPRKSRSIVPPGQTTPTAYLGVKDAKAAIAFYAKAFGAKLKFKLTEPGGKIGHAELAIGTSMIMLAEEYPDFGCLSPQTIGGSPVQFHLYVKNADAAVTKALKAGAVLVRPVQDQFYGDRTGTVADPFGYKWMIAQCLEIVPPKEMQKRWRKMFEVAK